MKDMNYISIGRSVETNSYNITLDRLDAEGNGSGHRIAGGKSWGGATFREWKLTESDAKDIIRELKDMFDLKQ